MFDIENYDYDLPPSSIAQVPVSKRDHSRLFVVDRQKESFSDCYFYDLPELLDRGDIVVVNDTRVVPARIFGNKESGGRIEILVLEYPDPEDENIFTRLCLLRSSKRPTIGSMLYFDSGVSGQVKEVLDNGLVRIAFRGERSIDSLLEEKGLMPVPPYIKRGSHGAYSLLDKERYQTVFAKQKGAVAAPTAGLHFTEDLIRKLEKSGISIGTLTLHVGYGTFRPVRTADIRDHFLDQESYRIEPETVAAMEKTKKKGGRVVAVGTTVVRALETAACPGGLVAPGRGSTRLLITPGFTFKVVDALITNFHLPKSSLLFLVSAFGGLDLIKEAYGLAVERGYRFYSYGDAMLIV